MKKVVRTFLRNKEGKFLMVKHIGKDYWSLPGGHVEKKENVYKALKREIIEELNIEIKILGDKIGIEIKGIKERPKPLCVYKISYCPLREKEIKNLEYIFISEMKSEEVILKEDEIAKYDFFTKDEIINIINTHKQVKILAEKL